MYRGGARYRYRGSGRTRQTRLDYTTTSSGISVQPYRSFCTKSQEKMHAVIAIYTIGTFPVMMVSSNMAFFSGNDMLYLENTINRSVTNELLDVKGSGFHYESSTAHPCTLGTIEFYRQLFLNIDVNFYQTRIIDMIRNEAHLVADNAADTGRVYEDAYLTPIAALDESIGAIRAHLNPTDDDYETFFNAVAPLFVVAPWYPNWRHILGDINTRKPGQNLPQSRMYSGNYNIPTYVPPRTPSFRTALSIAQPQPAQQAQQAQQGMPDVVQVATGPVFNPSQILQVVQ